MMKHYPMSSVHSTKAYRHASRTAKILQDRLLSEGGEGLTAQENKERKGKRTGHNEAA